MCQIVTRHLSTGNAKYRLVLSEKLSFLSRLSFIDLNINIMPAINEFDLNLKVDGIMLTFN